MEQANFREHRRLRVDSCQKVIHDLSLRLDEAEIHPKIIEQLRRLDELLELIDPKTVTEEDLARIEQSTNQLLNELSGLFNRQGINNLYGATLN